jgi:hypothetical protein
MADTSGNQVLIPGLVKVGLAIDIHGHLPRYDDAPLLAMGMIRKADTLLEYEKDNLLFLVVEAVTGDTGNRHFDLGQRKNFRGKGFLGGLSPGNFHMSRPPGGMNAPAGG